MKDVVIVSGVRTPIGKFGRSLNGIGSAKLGEIVMTEAVNRAGIDPEIIDEVVMGCVLQAGLGQNVARQSMIYAGIPEEIPAMTIN